MGNFPGDLSIAILASPSIELNLSKDFLSIKSDSPDTELDAYKLFISSTKVTTSFVSALLCIGGIYIS